ncbi:MAG: ImmA/IrrE family metallo-endopeptidase [Pseudonocardia sp.]
MSAFDRLDAWQLAARYELPILPFDQLPANPATIRHFTATNSARLSGMLLTIAEQQLILINSADELGRVVSTIAHEVSHCILCHRSALRFTGENGCLSSDPDQEEEAAWLGGELLVPRAAARRLVFNDIGEDEAAAIYGVSVEMVRWRMNICGAKQMQRRVG